MEARNEQLVSIVREPTLASSASFWEIGTRTTWEYDVRSFHSLGALAPLLDLLPGGRVCTLDT